MRCSFNPAPEQTINQCHYIPDKPDLNKAKTNKNECLLLRAYKNGSRMVDHICYLITFLFFFCDPTIINGTNLRTLAVA